MPDLRNGSLEGEQYLEELQAPPSPCTSLKNSSLLCSLSLCCAGDGAGSEPAASLWRHGLAFQAWHLLGLLGKSVLFCVSW